MAAQRGINVGSIHQASRTFTAAPRNQPKPKPKPKPAPPPPKPAPPVKKNTVTLKPLVNRKGKVVGYGHFKGNEVQDRSKIPKSAPKTPAAKQKLAAAIAATPKNQITPAAKKKQAEVTSSNMPKPNKKFNQYIRSLPTDGSAGDINQISRSYIESGQGGAALQKQLQDDSAQRAAAAQAAALAAQQQKLAELQAQRNEQARKAAEEAARQAAIAEARRKKLEAQRTMGAASGQGRGGLKLTGVKERSSRATRRSRRSTLSANQLNLSKNLASLLKVGNLNLG